MDITCHLSFIYVVLEQNLPLASHLRRPCRKQDDLFSNVTLLHSHSHKTYLQMTFSVAVKASLTQLRNVKYDLSVCLSSSDLGLIFFLCGQRLTKESHQGGGRFFFPFFLFIKLVLKITSESEKKLQSQKNIHTRPLGEKNIKLNFLPAYNTVHI